MIDEHVSSEHERDASSLVAPMAHVRWFKQRAAELGTTVSAASRAALGSSVRLGRALKGECEFKVKELPALAQVFGVSIPILLVKLGYSLGDGTGRAAEEELLVDRRARRRLEAATARYIYEAKNRLDQYERQIRGE